MREWCNELAHLLAKKRVVVQVNTLAFIMFRGVIKNNTRKILMDYIDIAGNPKIAVGCCGAFTIENILVNNFKPTHIISSDVSKFTTSVGYFLTGRDYEAKVVNKDFEFLNEVMEKGLDYKTATILYLQDVSDFYRSDNYYNIRRRKSYSAEYWGIIEKKVQRLNEVKAVFDRSGVDFTYKAQDVVDFVKEVPNDYLFVSFPPFYVGGYEKQYEFLEETLYAPDLECKYKLFDDSSWVGMVETLLDRGVSFIIGTNRPDLFEGNDRIEMVSYDYFSKSEIVHFLTDKDFAKKIAGIKRKKTLLYDVDLITKEDIDNMNEDTVIEVKEIPLDLFNSIRMTRISGKIKNLAEPLTKFGCFANGKLFGVFGVDVINMRYYSDTYYLLSDVPVINYKRISKLIPALATSSEILEYLKRKYLVGYNTIMTTCFTDNESSMKYRNFWRKDSVKVDKHKGKFINYVADMGKYNISGIYQKWLRLNTEITAKQG